MKLFFVRHAESNGNASGDYSTDTHDELSTLGFSQAQALAARLSGSHFDRIYCSPLLRTIQTIAPYAETLSADRVVEI